KYRAVIAARLVAEGAGEPTLADAGRSFDDQVLRLVDPATGDQGLEQRSVETAGGAIIDVFDSCLMAQPGKAQPGLQPSLVALGDFAVEQEAEPFGVRQRGAGRVCLQLGKGACHAGKSELVKLVEGRMGEQLHSPDRSVVVAGTADVRVIGQQL